MCSCAACNQQYDVALVIDASSTQSSFNFQQLLQGVSSTLEQFLFFSAPDYLSSGKDASSLVRLSVVTYSGVQRFDFALNYTLFLRDTIQANILAIQQHTSSGNDLSSALVYVSNNVFQPINGDRPGVQQAVIVFATRQSSDASSSGSLFSANHLKANGAVIVAVGVGPTASQFELQSIATQPAYATFVNSPSDLLSLSTSITIATEACTPLPASTLARKTLDWGGGDM